MAKPKKKAMRLKLGLLTAVAAFGVMAFGASSAQAVPFGTSFDNANLKIPIAGFDIVDPPDQATIAGELTLGSPSTFTVPPTGFVFPTFEGTVAGANLVVDLEATEDITGSVDSATGAVQTDPSAFVATLSIDFDLNSANDDICEIGDAPGGADTPDLDLAFNTNQPFPSPYAGDPFTVSLVATPPLQDGAIVATWPTLPTAVHASGTEIGNCSLINSLTNGRGALWIAEGLTSPTLNTAPPVDPGTPPPANPTPVKKKCKKGQKLKKGKCVKKKKKKKK